jgi:S1-C subfamily serine protease
MKKPWFCTIIAISFLGCVSQAANVTLSSGIPYQFYIDAREDDPLNIYTVIQTEIEKRGYNVHKVIPNLNNDSQEPTESSGSGFFISKDTIITCDHVISGSRELIININGTGYPAQVLQSNSSTDLAILRVIGYENPYFFNISSFSKEELGNKIYTIGYPLSNILGAEVRITDGIISAKNGINSNPTYFQMSASIQPGNSGGPVLNDKFEVIGITSSKLSEIATLQTTGTLSQNVNFAVKSDYALLMANEYTNNTIKTVSSISDSLRATVHVIANQKSNQNNENGRINNNIIVSISYTYYWDVIHYVITNLKIDFFNPSNGRVVGTGTHRGDTLSGAESTARTIINQMLDKIK